jgi:predicted nucleotidyltransferase
VKLLKLLPRFTKYFGNEDHLWLFGSRVSDQQRGGDIDFLIETHEPDARKSIDNKFKFVNELLLALGDQKIDVVIRQIEDPVMLPIFQIAKQQGIQLK